MAIMKPVSGWGGRCFLLATVLAIASVNAGTVLAQESYTSSLSVLLSEASDFLSQASEAIDGCNQDFTNCLRQPDEFADQIDQAREGLEGVLADLGQLTPPGNLASSHDLLQGGFLKVINGLSLYAEGIREADAVKLGGALDLVHSGRVDIEAATAAITSSGGSGGLDPILILEIVGGVAIAMMGVLIALLVRQARRTRLAQVESELATCPVCGEVLDGWQTYRSRQIREWRTTHLLSHKVTDKVLEGRDPGESP